MNQERTGQELPSSNRLPQRTTEGMIVCDSAGKFVGTIRVAYFGGASEEAIQKALHSEAGENDLSNLPNNLGARLMSQGYIIVEGPDLSGARRYIGPDQIEGVFSEQVDDVVQDIVRLRVTRDELLNR